MVERRKPIPPKTQTLVLRRSRRRCCICFGLHRDDAVKKGQIAHLDKNRNNNDPDNLAWMCLEHHDEFDSRTSQTKSLQPAEAKAYRDELYELYASWESFGSFNQLLNFLASTISHEDILAGAIKVAGRYRFDPKTLLEEVLTEPIFESMDMDRWVPHLAVLEDLQRWGLLKFSLTEPAPDEVRIEVEHGPICRDLLERLRQDGNGA